MEYFKRLDFNQMIKCHRILSALIFLSLKRQTIFKVGKVIIIKKIFLSHRESTACDKSANYAKHLKCSKTGYKERAGTFGKC